MTLLLLFTLFFVSTFTIVKSADYFVDAVERIGTALRLPHFITGVLIVAVGTSLPELATGISAILKEDTDIVIASVLGSGISNIFLGLGLISVLVRKNIKFKQNIFQVHFPIFIISVVAVIIMFLGDLTLQIQEGIILVGIMGAYLWFLFTKDGKRDKFHHEKFRIKDVLIAITSLLFLIGGSNIAIDTVLKLALELNINTGILAGTLVAVGTSLPEMVVVFSALKKGNSELAIGNILGSNIFNIVLILGVGSFIAPLTMTQGTWDGMIPFTLGSIFVYWAISKDQEITRQEGLAMTFLYGLFLAKLFGWF